MIDFLVVWLKDTELFLRSFCGQFLFRLNFSRIEDLMDL
jgi:hypothetical protein